MTASTKPSMIDHFPLQQILKTEVGTAVVVSGDIKLLLVDLSCGGKNSVYNQCMDDSTDTTSIISSADSSIAMSVTSYSGCCCSSSSSSEDDELIGRRITSSTTGTAPKSALKQGESGVVPSRLQRQEKSRCRRIQFNPAVQQQRYLALHEYTTKELDACWLRGEEYAQIARSCRKQITMLEQQDCQHDAMTPLHHHHHFQDEEYCFRGLESHARLAAVAKNLNRHLAWDAVLDEQCDQLFLGVLDDDAMASKYRNASSSCQFWANRVAQQDQRVAEEFEYEDDIILVLQD